MKKLYASLLAKVIAAFLWSGAIIGIAVSIGNMIYTYDTDYDYEMQSCKENIMYNLAANAIDIIPVYMDEEQQQTGSGTFERIRYDNIIEQMEGNMEFALVGGQYESLSEVDLSDPSVYFYKSEGFDKDSYSYTYEGVENSYFYPETESLIALSSGQHFQRTYDSIYTTEKIRGYVLEEKTGILYIKTSKAAYRVENFTVWKENGKKTSRVYHLSENGKYVSEDGEVLDWEAGDIGISLKMAGSNGEDDGESGAYEHINKVIVNAKLEWNINAEEEKNSYEQIYTEKEVTSEKKTLNGYITENNWLYVRAEDYSIYWVLMEPKTPVRGSLMAQLELVLGRVYALKEFYPALILLGIIIFFVTGIFLLRAAGHGKKEGKVSLSGVRTVWLGVLTASVVALEILGAAGITMVIEFLDRMPLSVFVYLTLTIALLMLLLFAAYLLEIAVRLKAHKFMRYTIVYHIYRSVSVVWRFFVRHIRRFSRNFKEKPGLVTKSLLIMLALWLFEMFLVLLACIAGYEMEMFGMAATFSLCAALLFLEKGLMMEVVLQLHHLQKGSERIAAGEIESKIDTKGLFWEFKKHGDNINKIRDGIQAAVQEQMKSEHFKTELITNVTHDIKTPLTSIINYVDLIKKEEVADPTLQSYVEVLDRQSARLKKLIEDLMEASKASTGSLEVNFEQCDVGVLITQMVGEYEERAAAESLQFIVGGSNTALMIMADGRHLWRVFDNLLGNACKYAMPGTRVYVDLHMEDIEQRVAVITFKNVSKSQLNISSEELMERFVRGDSSRNTEGSGLGLSIAQSLTELMGGTMLLLVDGDLFKVILRFPIQQ